MGTERGKSSLDEAIHIINEQVNKEPQTVFALVGPTASGKTNLALALAEKFSIEIVSTDSRLLYRGMDIGTAKPNKKEQQICPHHLIDILNPDQIFSAAQFQENALAVIGDIFKRDHLPLLVGGTMLYIDAVLYNYQWPEEIITEETKQQWRQKSLSELQKQALALYPEMGDFIDIKNPVRLQRVLMHYDVTGNWLWEEQKKGKPLFPTVIMGLNPDREILRPRIIKRVNDQWLSGLVA